MKVVLINILNFRMPSVSFIIKVLELALLTKFVSAQSDFSQFSNTRDRNTNGNNFNSIFNNNNNNNNDQLFTPRENSPNFTFVPNFNTFNPNSGTNQQRRPNFGAGNRGFGGGFQDYGDNRLYPYPGAEDRKCPPEWELYRQNCYRFVRSPIHNREGARLNCKVGAEVLSSILWMSHQKDWAYLTLFWIAGLWKWISTVESKFAGRA